MNWDGWSWPDMPAAAESDGCRFLAGEEEWSGEICGVYLFV